MKMYTIRVYFTSFKDVEVSADCEEDAMELAKRRVGNNEHNIACFCEVSEVFNMENEQ